MNRVHRLVIRVNDDERARIDELRSGLSRPAFMRSLLRSGLPAVEPEVATHAEALGILTRLARDDGTAAAIALERALRASVDPAATAERDIRGKLDELKVKRLAREKSA
jgi:hypothetical protein